MTKISSRKELVAEQKRLLQKRAQVEMELSSTVAKIKEEFTLGNIIKHTLKKILVQKDFGMTSMAFGVSLSWLLKRVLVKNAGPFARILVPLLTEDFISHLGDKSKLKIVDFISRIIEKFKFKPEK
jgi:hypothetical protein